MFALSDSLRTESPLTLARGDFTTHLGDTIDELDFKITLVLFLLAGDLDFCLIAVPPIKPPSICS